MTTATHPIRRRLLGLTMLLGLTTGGVIIAPAAPAQAVPGASWVTTLSNSNSYAKQVTATCPVGSVVYGAAGRIVNGGGKVLITDLVPDATLSSVRVQGAENDPYGANWQVEAKAICAPDNGHGLHLVEGPSSANGSNLAPRSAYAPCPEDEVVFGTGAKVRNGGGNILIAEVEPNAALTQVEVEVWADNGFTGVFDNFAYAICGKANGSVVQLTSRTSAFGVAASRTADTPLCPQGTVTGVGGKITDNTNGILLDRLDANTALSRSTATGRDNAAIGTPYDVTAFGICVT